MSPRTAQPDPRPFDAALRRLHRGVLATLAVCALLIATAPPSDAETADPRFTAAALALAAASILSRRIAPRTGATPRAHALRSVASPLLAGVLGLVGVALVWSGGPRGSALLYTAAGALLSLRTPVRRAPGGAPPAG